MNLFLCAFAFLRVLGLLCLVAGMIAADRDEKRRQQELKDLEDNLPFTL